MEGVVPAADPVGQLERCQEEINHTRHDVQVRQPRLFHVAMVELILRQRARRMFGMSMTKRATTVHTTIKRSRPTAI